MFAFSLIRFQFDIGESSRVSESDEAHNYAVSSHCPSNEKSSISIKVDEALKAVKEDVIYLNSSSNNVEKFSVRTSNNGHQFVHVYKANSEIFYNKCSSRTQFDELKNVTAYILFTPFKYKITLN